MKFNTLALLGISLTLGVRGEQDEYDDRNLKRRTRVPRMKKTDIIAALESKLAAAASQISSLQNTVTSLQANVTASTSTIAVLQENVAASTSTIAALQANITTSMSTISTCQAQLKSSFTGTQVNSTVYTQLVSEYAYNFFDAVTPSSYKTINRLSNGVAARNYEVAGDLILSEYNPEPAYYLHNADDDTLLRDMQGPIFEFQTVDANEPSDVTFDLPAPPAYSQPSDLYFKTILELAALLRAGTVDCVTLVTAFIDRLSDIDSSLGIVATPLYDRAMVMAADLDVKLKNGIDLGPLMCIPFGIKDHHQIFDDEPTMYGHIAYSYNVQKTKSTAANHLMKYGAIPIAKTMLGTLASGSGNGWGMCMSPYLNGPGGGSSCGSGSGAAYGAFPFAVSEETNGSVASPAAANLVSGHITSYGLVSRGGAGLLTHEQDHLGFHSRYLSDFGVILNYFRTGKDPLDGDSLDIKYVNPAKVDVTKLRVMIVAGEGKYTTNVSSSYTGKIQAYGKSGWHWPERVEKMKARLLAAGVTVDVIPSDAEANRLWSFNRTTPYHRCANPSSLSSNGAEARFQQFEFAMMNSKRKSGGKGNMPVKSYRYLKKCMVEIGKKYLNDPIWSKYDVIIDTPYDRGGGYDSPASGFEMWVRTAKTFVMDYYEALPCATPQGDTVEGAYATLTALPHQDYKNFAIGAIIQDTSAFIFPNTTAIKKAFANRERCAFTMMTARNDMLKTCSPLNTPGLYAGAPPGPTLAGYDGSCVIGGTQQHLPTPWANSTYVAPYLLPLKCPDEGLWAWSEFKPIACTAVCPFVPSFCKAKNITCTARRLAEEKKLHRPGMFTVDGMYDGDNMRNHPLYVNHDDES